MEGELGLPTIDWGALQPSLTPTIKRAAVKPDGSVSMRETDLIDYKRFLQV